MKSAECIENKLSIIIVTYNRCSQLEKTLRSIDNSPIRNCSITVLDNKSGDNTRSMCLDYAKNRSNFKIVTHPANLGSGSANIVQAINYCYTEYMWILCDDDTYDFSSFDDVQDEILKGRASIIQVGAHDDGLWDWGVFDTPRNLVKKGYNYFKYSSFTPCSIIKYSYFLKNIKEAYNFIPYRYSHFPNYALAYEEDMPVYVSKKRIVKATIGVQTYSNYIPFRGFIMLSRYLSNINERRELIMTVLPKSNSWIKTAVRFCYEYRKEDDVLLVRALLLQSMSIKERIIFVLLSQIYGLKCFILSK